MLQKIIKLPFKIRVTKNNTTLVFEKKVHLAHPYNHVVEKEGIEVYYEEVTPYSSRTQREKDAILSFIEEVRAFYPIAATFVGDVEKDEKALERLKQKIGDFKEKYKQPSE